MDLELIGEKYLDEDCIPEEMKWLLKYFTQRVERAILLYLREITGMNSKQLSLVLASLKKTYKDIKKKEEHEIF